MTQITPASGNHKLYLCSMIFRPLYLLFFLNFGIQIFNSQLSAQEITKGNLNSWFLQYSRFKLGEHWMISNEIHYRTGQFLSDPGLLLIRPSIDFHLNSEVEFSVGYTFVHAEPFEPYSLQAPANENNVWWQAWIKSKIGRVKLQHRFRQEHRWSDKLKADQDGEYQKDGTRFSNRFRYRFTAIFDLFSNDENRSVFCVLFDEIWLNQNNQLLFTDVNRNWLYGGLGYEFNQNSNLQLGFNYQSDKISDGQFINSPVIQLTYFSVFDLGAN